jgi:hypothetical protein
MPAAMSTAEAVRTASATRIPRDRAGCAGGTAVETELLRYPTHTLIGRKLR